jgi:uncharacterized protein
MGLPSIEACFEILRDARMPEHIVAHSIQVCRVAEMLAGELRLDLGLVRAAALLHDVTKPESLETKEDHAVTGARLLAGMGHEDVARLVRQHVRLDVYFASEEPDEAEVVNYADKRVLHDRIVSLEQRMTYIVERYAVTEEHRRRIRFFWDRTVELERRLFDRLPFAPGDIEGLLPAGGFETYLSAYRAACAGRTG